MIWLIIILAFILRLINLNQSLWWDEAINVVYAQSSSFWWFVTKYPLGDFHPPGWFAILWIWGHLSSFSEISVRLPSVVFGVLTIYLTYLIGKELFSRKIGVFAALFLCFAPLHIYYSQEARMYSMAAFAISFSMYSLIRLISGKRYSLLLYILSTAFVLYSDYLAYFILPAQFIWVSIYNKKFLKKVFLSGVLFILLWSPWLLVFPNQLAGGQATAGIVSGWRDVVGGTNTGDFLLLSVKTITGRISFDNNLWYVVFFVILASPFIVSLAKLLKFRSDRRIYLLWFWLMFPPVLAFIISFWIPVFSYFRFIFILPAFYLLTAAGLLKFNPRLSKILTVFVILSGLIPGSVYLLNDELHREDWRGAVSFVSKNLDDRSIAIFAYNEIPAPVRYYGSNLSNFKPGLSEDLINNLENKDKVYLFEYLVDIYDPQRLVEQRLNNNNLVNTKTYDFRGVGFIKLYEK